MDYSTYFLNGCKRTKIIRRNIATLTLRCMPRKGLIVAFVIISTIASLALVFHNHTLARKLRTENLEATVAVLRNRLQFLQIQYQGKQQDVADAQAKIDSGCKLVAENEVSNTTYSPDLLALLENIRGSHASDGILSSEKPEALKAPFSLRIMPHLLDHPESLRPAYQLRSKRHYADYIIGIPHVQRDKETYLYETIKSLLDKMTDKDKKNTMIVVMIGETNLTYVVETVHRIEKTVPRAIDAGLIQVISPSKYYYPDLDALPRTLGDSKKRVKWRTKQNLDAIFLMAFAYSRCLYYLMIEDDVIAVDNFMGQIHKYTTEVSVKSPDWMFIQFSTTGGIGKLFRSTDLIHFITYIQLFYKDMPIDWLIQSYLSDRNCGIYKDTKKCMETINYIRPTYKLNLFKHIGLYSSLKGKLQKVKCLDRLVYGLANMSFIDPKWLRASTSNGPKKYSVKDKSRRKIHDRQITQAEGEKIKDFFSHDNPAVSKIKCDIKPHENYTIEKAYNGLNYFWGISPDKGNVIEFWFKEPGKFDRYLVRSGNIKHVNDKIVNAVFEILPVANTVNGTFVTIDHFDEFGFAEGQIDSRYGDLYAMRIRFLSNARYWVAIVEIEFVQSEQASRILSRAQAGEEKYGT